LERKEKNDYIYFAQLAETTDKLVLAADKNDKRKVNDKINDKKIFLPILVP
jgi:hypothetical protein